MKEKELHRSDEESLNFVGTLNTEKQDELKASALTPLTQLV
jgi:hypothetical protein